ncbi:MAG TPA: dTDP-4-dehydrorhamnose reductase [Fontimonas sp.]
MSKVLVTGAHGQLGLELRATAPADVEFHGVDLAELDITQAEAVLRFVEQLKPAVIINCAAYTAVDKAEADSSLAYAVNRDGAQHLAAAAKRAGARLVQVSTDFVFDGRQSTPYRVNDRAAPLGVYGQSKLEGEQAAATATAGDALIVRTAWLYSPHGQNFVKTMLRLMREKPQLNVVADQIGTPTSATTLAQSIWALLACEAPGGIYHCTDSGAASWYDFACAIRELALAAGEPKLAPVLPIPTSAYPTPAQRPAYSVLDKSATAALIGTAPHWREPLKSVIARLLA